MPLDAYIVGAVRTPAGKNRGQLSKWHPVDLGAAAIDALIERTKIDGGLVDDVIFGCVSQVGAQSGNLGRNVVLAAKSLPEHVPGTTVDRQCGSAQQAVHFAVQAVLSGTMDVVIAGGVESMSSIPIGASIMDGMKAGHGNPFTSEGIAAKYPGKMFSQFAGAELLAKKYKVTREEMDKFGVESHKRALAAIKNGNFDREIAPVKGQDKEGKEILVKHDEGVRPDVTFEKMSKLQALQADGVVTAGTASQISDGAAAILIVNSAGLKKLGLKPRARIVAMSVVGSDPEIMLEGPIPATIKVLKTAGLKIEDIDLYEVNEAFGSVPLAWAKGVGADLAKLNVNGGAIALGHPLGCTGAKLMTTLVHELERRNARYGLQAICEGGGTANAIIIERIGAGAAKL
jgi:acetyl-CoA acetyltransferase family protein